MSIKVGFISLGCPKNLINTEVMLAKLAENGFTIVADDFEADVIVINTCAFIESAKSEAIDNVLDIAWLKDNRGLKGIVLAGCLAQRYKEEIFAEMPEVDAVIGTGSYNDIIKAVQSVYDGEKFSSFGDIDLCPTGGERVVTTPEYFVYLQISEGCDNCCSYCVIPSIRGKYRSRPMEDILQEAADLASLGAKELCIIAQDTTRYGEDLYGVYSLDSLLKSLSEIDGIEWIRILYCYPDKITEGLIREIKENDKIVKYIDMPIQHISNDILKAMNRRSTGEDIRNAVINLRNEIPGITLRTTVITGFPGETEDNFKELLAFVKEARFDRLGVFKYSREEGTPAYEFENQVPEKTKEKRYDIIMREQQKIHIDSNNKKIGKTMEVLCEGYDKNAECFYGRSQSDAYDIDGRVYFRSSKNIKPGGFVNIKITETIDYDLFGTAVF